MISHTPLKVTASELRGGRNLSTLSTSESTIAPLITLLRKGSTWIWKEKNLINKKKSANSNKPKPTLSPSSAPSPHKPRPTLQPMTPLATFQILKILISKKAKSKSPNKKSRRKSDRRGDRWRKKYLIPTRLKILRTA